MRLLAAVAILLVLTLPSVGASPEGADYEQTDPSGDVSPITDTPAGVPVSPASSYVDLTALRIENEDETGFDIVLEVAQLKVSDGPGGICCFMGISVHGEFQLAGAKPIYYFYAYVNGSPGADAETSFVAMARYTYASFYVCEQNCAGDDLEASLDDAANTIRFHFAKTNLLRGGLDSDGPIALPSNLRPGDQLSGLSVEVRSSGLTEVPLYDAMPNDADALPPYVFKTGAANTVIRLDLPETFGGLAVVPGLNQSIPFRIANHGGGKRLLGLEYILEGPTDKLVNYAVFGPAALTVPADEARNFTLAVDTKPGAKATDGVRLLVRATSAGRPDEIGFASDRLVPGATLGPESNVLYFHPLQVANFGEPVDTATCSRGLFFRCGDGFLSPLEQDPEATTDGPIRGSTGLGAASSSQYFYIDMLHPLAQALSFAPDRPIAMELTLRSPVQADGLRVAAEMYYYGNGKDSGTLMSAAATAAIDTAGTLVKIEAPAELGDQRLLTAGTSLGLFLRVSSSLSPTGTAAWGAGGIELLPAKSRITLPLLELPESLRNIAKATPFQLSVVGDREEFVNPGEARLMNITLLNQDAQSHRAELRAQIDREGWSAEIYPGAAYDLDATDTVKLGVLVHAPKDAKEGAAAVVRIVASDESGTNVTLPLSVIATDGFDFRDDSLGFESDADARAKLAAGKGNDTPGFEGVLAGLAVLAVAGRRRRKA